MYQALELVNYVSLLLFPCHNIQLFEQNRTLLKTMHLRPLTGGVRDKHKHVMQ